MLSVVGIILVFAIVFGVFAAHGGDLQPIFHAAPAETIIILGSAIAAMVAGNSMPVVKATFGGFGKILAGPKFKKQDYLDVIFLVSKMMKLLKAEGAVALESHVENPDASALFAEYPRILKDHALVHLITDNIRLLVVSSPAPKADSIEDIMNLSIKTHHHDALIPADNLAMLAGSLPALGIVACVLGVVKTMGSIDQPPAVLGALIGGALVGTFLGVLLAYGVVEPLGNRLKQIINDEGQIYHVVKQILVGSLNGHPIPVVIEAARVAISHENQPSFSEVFDGLRGK
jgi:chemotaxis protein MotA